MTRTIRLTCPDCSANLRVSASDNTPHFTCPRCDKKLVVCVAPRSTRKLPAQAGGNRTSQQPELDESLSEERLGVPTSQTPLQAQFQNLKTSKSRNYYRPPKHPWVTMRPYVLVAATTSGILSILAVVWFSSGVMQQVQTVKWPSLKQFADSHKSLYVDFIDENERQLQTIFGNNANRAALLGTHLREHQVDYEDILLRAVRLGEASRASRAELGSMLASAHSRLQEKLGVNETGAVVAYADEVQTLLDRLLTSVDAEHDSLLYQVALSGYLLSGIFELPPPRNEAEEIFVDEVRELRGLLKRLAGVKSRGQLGSCATDIEDIAERLLDLAARSSKHSNGFWERMPSEYWPIDQSFAIVQKALLRRLERDFGLDEKLKDALADVALARQSIVESSLGTTEATLRVRFAEARAKRQKTLGRPMKLRMTQEDRDFILQHWCCTNSSLQSLLADSSEPEPPATPVESYRPANVVAANPATSIMASGPRNSGLLASGGPKTNVATGEQPTPTANSNLKSNTPQSSTGQSFTGQSSTGQASTGRSMGNKSPGREVLSSQPHAQTDAVLRSEVEQFNGPYTVKIYIINNDQSLGTIVDKLVKRLFVRDSFSLSLDNKAIIGLRFAGELKEVSRVIDFGEVIEEDDKVRIIRVRGCPAD